jgi:hypothetical protein
MTTPKTAVRARSGVSAASGEHSNANGTTNSFVHRMRVRILALRIVSGRAPNVDQVLKTLKP